MPFHVFLFGIFFILFLYTFNQGKVPFHGFLLPLGITLLTALSLWVLISLLLSNRKKAGLIVSLFFIVFFFYGHIHNIIVEFNPQIDKVGHLPFQIIFLIILSVGILYFLKTKRKLDNATKITNAISITLIGLILINISIFYFDSVSLYNEFKHPAEIFSGDQKNTPDIYFILLDGYVNSIVSKEILNHDNIEFITFLKENGFYIPENYTHSNYDRTIRTIPSVLNMNYLDPAILELTSVNQQFQVLYELIDDNIVMNYLKSNGYQIINFDSGWWGTEKINIADKNLCATPLVDYNTLNKLEQTTMSKTFQELHRKIASLLHDQKRKQILCEFSELEKIKDNTERPFFVFVHIVAPHPPWVFGSEGEPVKKIVSPESKNIDNQQLAYVDQLKFVNKMMMELVSKLLSNTENPPIIIIQSDHGTRATDDRWTQEERFMAKVGNFNAFFLPGNGTNLMYEEITPVNTFRIIFNSYFNTDLELLEDNKVLIGNNWIYDLKQSVDNRKN